MIRGIISVIGADGCGKSTLLRELSVRGFPTSSWKDIPKCANGGSTIDLVQKYINFLATTRLSSLLPPLSTFSLNMSLLFAEYEFCIQPQIAKRGFVIVDSYYLKPLARARVKGDAWPRILDINAFLPPPAAIVLLDVRPEVAYVRKGGNISEYEVRKSCTQDDFMGFQRDVIIDMLRLAEGIRVLRVDGEQSAANVCRDFLIAMGKCAGRNQ